MGKPVRDWNWAPKCGMKVVILNGGADGDGHQTGDIGEIINVGETSLRVRVGEQVWYHSENTVAPSLSEIKKETKMSNKLYVWIDTDRATEQDLLDEVSKNLVTTNSTIEGLIKDVEENGDELKDGTIFVLEIVDHGTVKPSYAFQSAEDSDC